MNATQRFKIPQTVLILPNDRHNLNVCDPLPKFTRRFTLNPSRNIIGGYTIAETFTFNQLAQHVFSLLIMSDRLATIFGAGAFSFDYFSTARSTRQINLIQQSISNVSHSAIRMHYRSIRFWGVLFGVSICLSTQQVGCDDYAPNLNSASSETHKRNTH